MLDQNIHCILVAGGQGTRLNNDQPKQFLELGAQRVIDFSLDLFTQLDFIDGITVVLSEDYFSRYKSGQYNLAPAGETRHQSVVNALNILDSDVEWVLIHDAARPFVDRAVIESTLQQAFEYGAAVAAVPVVDTIKLSSDQCQVEKTLDRRLLFKSQTPQVFKRSLLEQALKYAEDNQIDPTDEALLLEQMGVKVALAQGSALNFKITNPEDLSLARAWVSHRKL